VQYQIGLFNLELGKNEEALKAFESVLKLCDDYESSPADFAVTKPEAVVLGVDKARRQAYYMKAQAFERLKKFPEALKDYKKALAVAPDFFGAHFSLAELYYKLGRLDSAQKHFRKVLETEPEHVQSLTYMKVIEEKLIAREKRRQPSLQKVLLLYEAALRDYRTGEKKQAQKKLLEATKVAKKLKSNSEVRILSAQVALLLGKTYFDTDENEKAQQNFLYVLELLSEEKTGESDPILGDGYFHLGSSYEKKGENEKAVAPYQKSVPLLRGAVKDAENAVQAAEFLVQSARANRFLSRHDEELSDYLQVARLLPTYPLISFICAEAAMRADKPAKAAELFKKSIEQKVKIAESFFQLGKLLFERGKYTDAIVYFETTLEQTSEEYYLAACNYYIGHAYYAIEFYPEAVAAWREYIKHAKDTKTREIIEKKLAEDPKLKDK